ncbi:MAG TPA: Mor transcription activator family protein [Sulfuriferula sp.]|nr:Mor transcription activator family protein [Sulfuriferula sp.]
MNRSDGNGMRSFVLPRARAANYIGVFQDICQLIGEAATAKLVAQYGGTRLYLPVTVKPEHPLCELLGEEIAQKLAGEFSGLSVEIPRAVKLLIGQRNALIFADRALGVSQRKLALKYRMTERNIRNILNQPPK